MERGFREDRRAPVGCAEGKEDLLSKRLSENKARKQKREKAIRNTIEDVR